MSKRGENIRKRKDGRWEGRYRNGTDSRGRPRYSSIYGKSYGEVKENLLQAKASLPFTSLSKKNATFGDGAKMWLESNSIRLKGATKSKYYFLLKKHLLPELAQKKLSDLDAAFVNRFLSDKLKEGSLNGGQLSPSYVRTMSIIIGAILDYSSNEGLCPPLKNRIFKPRLPKNHIKVLSSQELDVLEAHLMTNTDPIKLGALISLNTGMRLGEICALSKEDVDLSSRCIHVRRTVSKSPLSETELQKTVFVLDTPKTDSSARCIPINSKLFPILKNACEESQSAYLVSDNSSFMRPSRFDYHFRRMVKECGLPPFGFHTLRHTFATHCIQSGVDIKTLSTVLGHSGVSITLDTYVHPTEDITRQQLERLCTPEKMC